MRGGQGCRSSDVANGIEHREASMKRLNVQYGPPSSARINLRRRLRTHAKREDGRRRPCGVASLSSFVTYWGTLSDECSQHTDLGGHQDTYPVCRRAGTRGAGMVVAQAGAYGFLKRTWPPSTGRGGHPTPDRRSPGSHIVGGRRPTCCSGRHRQRERRVGPYGLDVLEAP